MPGATGSPRPAGTTLSHMPSLSSGHTHSRRLDRGVAGLKPAFHINHLLEIYKDSVKKLDNPAATPEGAVGDTKVDTPSRNMAEYCFEHAEERYPTSEQLSKTTYTSPSDDSGRSSLTQLIGQLHQMTQAKLKGLAAQSDQIETLAKLNSCLHFMRENLRTGNESNVLMMKANTVQQVKELTTPFQ